jgi:uncharacterized protein YdiU (UPF0061 family)
VEAPAGSGGACHGAPRVDDGAVNRAISALPWERRFVDSLPADPRREVVSRQVRGAAYSWVTPTPVSSPRLLALVPEVAALVGLDPTETPELVAALAGNRVLDGMAPYAAAYAGHQFGNWAGQLGDGRAITLGEVRGPGGASWELQLKGAGPTPYSRAADGRAVLRSSLRELVASEAMYHLGVPTTRALSLVTTGDFVIRDILYDGHSAPEPGAIVCRVAPSFLRFGNFQLFAVREEHDLLRRLARFTLETHYPEYVDGERLDLAGFLAEVARRTARMIVGWMRVGFVHGVMNTDNMSTLGLTIDYGPYGFLEPFEPDWTPNTTDAHGRRYRWGHQPRVGLWNLAQLARALVPLVDDPDTLEGALEAYADLLGEEQHRMMLAKLGLSPVEAEGEADASLIQDLFERLMARETDMTWFYRTLAEVSLEPGAARASAARLVEVADYAPNAAPAEAVDALAAWVERYAARVGRDPAPSATRAARMNAVNPAFVPRNHVLQTVIDAATEGDLTPLHTLLEVLKTPYDAQPGREGYFAKRPEWARHKPGCSMLSCSS